MNGDLVAVVLGARNLGGAILDHLVSEGWRGAAVARSEETAAAVRERGALGIAADASDRRRSTRRWRASGLSSDRRA